MPTARTRTTRWRRGLLIGVLVVLLAGGGFALWWYEPFRPGLADCVGGTAPVSSTDRLAAGTTWGRHCDNISATVAELGIPEVNPYVEELHQHAHLSIEVGGRSVKVPAGIGIGRDKTPVSPLHTHTPDGLLHVESPTVRPYTLVEFMHVWGVRLTAECLGGYCTGPDGQLVIYVDGAVWQRPLSELVITDKQSVVILYGNAADTAPDKVEPVDWSRWDV